MCLSSQTTSSGSSTSHVSLRRPDIEPTARTADLLYRMLCRTSVTLRPSSGFACGSHLYSSSLALAQMTMHYLRTPVSSLVHRPSLCCFSSKPIGSGDQPLSPSKPVATPGRTSLFKALYDMLPLESLPRLRPRSRRRDSEGIIAPRSPTGPPPVSPVLGAISNMNLPSPLLSPRRVSSEAFRPLSRPGSPSFTLSPPPKRAIADESTREGQPLGGRRMEIRNRGSYGTGSTVDS